MTLAFRTLLSQAANQMRALLTSAPPDWTAAEDASATISLLALEEEIAVNIEHSDALINEAARFEEGQRLFLSAFGKLPAGSKDAEQKTYDDLLNEIRVDELQAECRQMISSLARRVRAYKRLESELRAQIAQAQARATTHVALDDNGSRDTSLLRDILQQNQQMMQQMMQHIQDTQQTAQQTMQDMLQAFTLQIRPATPSVDDQHRPATPPAVSAVNSTASHSLLTTALPVSEPPPTANNTLQSVSGPVSSAPGGPLPVSTASMPIYTTRNMGAQSTHSSHWTTPLGPGFGQQFGQHHAQPQYFSSPFDPPVQPPLQDDRFRLPLPKIQIPYFYGEQSLWRDFWQRYELIMSRHPELSNLERLILLLGYLKGDAEKLVKGIPITESNYQLVVSLLKDAYDDKQTIIRAKLKELYFQFSSICRQLELEGEAPSHNPVLWNIVLDKLSSQTLRQIIPMEPKLGWTVDTLKAALKTVIDHEKKFAEYRGDKLKSTKREKTQNEAYQHQVLDGIEKQRSPNGLKCFFCQESHWSVLCSEYPDHDSRWERCKQIGLCTKCLRKGHRSKDCDKDYTCQICEKNHLKAICPKCPSQHESKRDHNNDRNKEKRDQKPNRNVNSVTVSDENEDSSDEESDDESSSEESTEPANQINTLIAAQANSDAEKTVSQTLATCKTTQCLTTMFMAAEAKVFNPQKPNRSATALIILDSASHLTFISDKLAREMSLPIDRKLKLCLSPFSDDSNRVVKLKTTAVKFGLQFSNGRQISIKGYTKNRIAGPSPLAVLKEDDMRRFWNKHPIPAELRIPDILIGIDTFHRFKVERGEKLHNGFYLSSTALGPVLSGRGKLPATQFMPQSNSIQLIGNISGPDSIDLPEKPEHSIANKDANTLCLKEDEVTSPRRYFNLTSPISTQSDSSNVTLKSACLAKPIVPVPAVTSLEDQIQSNKNRQVKGMTCLPREGSLMIKKSGNIANTGQIPQAKTPSQGAKIQVPTINGRRNILSQIQIDLTNTHREPAPRIPKFSPRRQNEGMFRAGSKTIDTVPTSLMLTTARQNGRITHEKILGFQSELKKTSARRSGLIAHENASDKISSTTALRSGLSGQENVIPKIMTTARRSGLRNLAVSTSRQNNLKAKVQQYQNMPKYCQSGRIPEMTRQSAVPQPKNHTRGQKSHKEWAVDVFYAKKHNLRHQTKLDQSRVGERRAYYRCRQQNLSRDQTDIPTEGPLDRYVLNQAPINAHCVFIPADLTQTVSRCRLAHSPHASQRNCSDYAARYTRPNSIRMSSPHPIRSTLRSNHPDTADGTFLASGVSRAESRKELKKPSNKA
ncbi:putative peptidase (DUF1758) domain-containing protein [Ditylenchus destructor]|uniref:Peptidase (DUF1758) domain-containing protein n=1 Tax=Ditylenchus destructor TaxID=166010 RepID=A0AAD4R2Q9_9BILA|nr:putative peptidase (DUF1758) domain-containing protein [Ditylenchus destructor]